MASLLEYNLYVAVAQANGVRQVAYAAAFATYAFVPANLAAYKTALIAADVAYQNSVATAATTAGITPNVIDENSGGFGGPWATIAT